ncbi:MAG: hypothetical protein IT371_10180 [Deltaproteobacteria bacterium]|nr:hypothetical protein [Deltaproteobacteria bacterium]
MSRRRYSLSTLAFTSLLVGCTSSTTPATTDAGGNAPDGARTDGGGVTPDGRAGGDGGASEAGGGAMLRIYVKGDLTPMQLNDGLSGQTPKTYEMGLTRFEVLRSATDPSPVLVFDHGATPRRVDLKGTTLAGEAPLKQLPAGSYTHGRIVLAWGKATVDATVHAQGMTIPGELTLRGALSDTSLDGKSYKQGEAEYTFKVATVERSLKGSLPALPSTGGGQVSQSGGKTYLTFAFPKPLVLSPSATKDHRATIVYKIFESFRWQEESKAGYATKVFDVDADGPSSEPVKNFGALDYAVETE